MTTEPIRIGVIGASPDRGWAAAAHLPVLRHLPQYEITAVGTRHADSAHRAARRYGAAHAFTDPRSLAGHPDVELVAIVVKVPDHARLVKAALAAGKHVLCEWPLARTTEEATELTAAAHAAGVVNAVGLQARHAPAVVRARELIVQGYVGRVTSVTVYSARGVAAGARLPAAFAYTLDSTNGAGTLEVAGGHTLDTVQYLLGREVTGVSAALSVQHPRITLDEDARQVGATGPDHVALHATLEGDAVLVAHIHDAKNSGGRTRIEISGTKGELAVVSAGPGGDRGLQISGLSLLGARGTGSALRELPLPGSRGTAGPAAGLDAAQQTMAAQYAALAADIRAGGSRVPRFADGLGVHRLLDAVRLSAAAGCRVERRADGRWPVRSPWPQR
ncbi:Gfo/Idh/MocA family oxidoreductase [Streptomyces sp. NPDC052721]|uniref:Gfo/Idh/MocA family protein n=1 Tax=Streptomyces sp. NPDC052721 TaxID=3154955 RepID=UPI003430D148